MKKVLLISVALAFLNAPTPANAYIIGNVSVSETGGVSVSNEVEASGSSEADASVRSVIRTEGSNTRVRVDIRTAEDGVVQVTSTDTVLEGVRRLEVRVDTEDTQSVDAAAGTSEVSTSSSPSRLTRAFDQMRASIARIFSFIFFFW